VVTSIVNVGAFASYMLVDMLAVAMSATFLCTRHGRGGLLDIYMSKVGLAHVLQPAALHDKRHGGVVYSGDLFTLFVFWEMIASPPTSWRSAGGGRLRRAAFKYLVMSGAGSATILLGISLLYGMSGTLSFEGLALAFGRSEPSLWLYVASIISLVGFGVKAAVVPLHTWLPDAHSAAPSPISASCRRRHRGGHIRALQALLHRIPARQSQWLP
jgi:formate hydrogenlyase subunit 3/multisubunit Na+/H+ antiporter MnhD subunit